MNCNKFTTALGLQIYLLIALFFSQVHAQQTTNLDNKVLGFLNAARTNDTQSLRRGLDSGVPVDSQDDSGRTALLIATYANAVEAAQMLIVRGADVNTKDHLEDSPYLYAGAEGRLEILKMTVNAGADLESVNRYGGTALTPAAHHGHVDIVRYLLTTEVDVNHVNNLGWTALLEAVVLGDGGPTYQKIVELLLNNGADRSIGDNRGVTTLEHAMAKNQDAIVDLLESTSRRKN